MSYEVLARKWRPLTFDDVVGQDHITRTLKKAVETNRLSHAYLFAGPRGCGKTSTARILARVINCENLPGDGNPCNKCESCRAVISGSNLDVMEIDGASHTGVDEVRDLQESIGYVPSQFRNKVYIIDEVHMLSTHAFNALLKTLEEPPPHVYFVFATTAPQKIPDTIKSRCQRHNFKRLEIKEISNQLRVICEAEKVDFDEEGLRLLARKADGSMRDGTSLLDQCITSSDGNITTDSVRDILGLIDQDKVFAFMESIAAGDPATALRLLSGCVDEGMDLQELCVALLDGYRDLMLLAAPGDLSGLLFASKDEVEPLRGVLPKYELPDLVTIVERLCNTTPRLKSAAEPRILLESLLVDLALLDRQVDIRELLAEVGSMGSGGDLEGRSVAKPVRKKNDSASSAPRAPAIEQPPRLDSGSASTASVADWQPGPSPAADRGAGAETIGKQWKEFVAFVRGRKFRLGVSLISGKVYSIDETTLTLNFAKSFEGHKEYVEQPDNMKLLRELMIEHFGRDIEVVCIVDARPGRARDTGSRAGTRSAPPAADGLRGVPEVKKPLVKKLIDEFDGEIVKYNPRRTDM